LLILGGGASTETKGRSPSIENGEEGLEKESAEPQFWKENRTTPAQRLSIPKIMYDWFENLVLF
jgi:hypothetical protein